MTPPNVRGEPLPIEKEARVPPSGVVMIAGLRQLWVGKNYAGLTVTLWIRLTSIHILLADEVIKTVSSRVTTANLEACPCAEFEPDDPTPPSPRHPVPAPAEERRPSNSSAPPAETASSLSAVTSWPWEPVSPGLG